MPTPHYSDLPKGASVIYSDLPAGAELLHDSPSPATTGATVSAGSAPSWLDNAEHDFTQGGKRTVIGDLLGTLQGRKDGFSGIESGVSKPAGDLMGSFGLGLIHAAQGAASIPEHPVKGTLQAVGGLGEAMSIPGMVMGGPGVAAGVEAVPSAKYAGKVLQDIMGDAGDVPVSLTNSQGPIARIKDLAATGSVAPKAVNQLAKRAGQSVTAPKGTLLQQMQNELAGVTPQPNTPLVYKEARDFASNISGLSADEQMSLTPTMKKALGDLRVALHSDIGAAADTVGRGEDYANAIKEYAQSMKLKDIVQTGKKYAVGAAGLGGLYAGYEKLKDLF